MWKWNTIGVILIGLACNTQDRRVREAVADVRNDAAVSCYRYVKDKDSVEMQITRSGDSITGSLVYHFYEKDNNKGMLQGRFVKDVLVADYTFESEGVTSVREVVFKLETDELVEGSGEMVVDSVEHKQQFRSMDSLYFDKGIRLQQVGCND